MNITAQEVAEEVTAVKKIIKHEEQRN
jgi:hypothetical protein